VSSAVTAPQLALRFIGTDCMTEFSSLGAGAVGVLVAQPFNVGPPSATERNQNNTEYVNTGNVLASCKTTFS